MGAMVTDKPGPGIRGGPAKVEVARQAFLYGQGDGRPVLDPAKLAEIAGCHVNTINKWMPGWLKQREEYLATNGNSEFGLSLSSETIEQHRKNTKFLEEQTTNLRREVAILDKLESVLIKAVESAQVHDPESATQVLAMVQSYLGSSAARKSLQTQFIAVQRAWKENAGIDSLQDVATAREKALATGRAKLDLKREADGAGPVPTGGREVPAADPVFDMGGEDMPADEAEAYG